MIKNYFFFLLIFSSCHLTKNYTIEFGKYYDRGVDYEYGLELNQDSTFFFYMIFQDAKPQCKGKWVYIENKLILLKCDDPVDISETLTNGYMNEREKKVRILDSNTIKIDNVVLEKMD